ncbi:histidine kinase [Ancylomarina sp. DW003]|nr:histidine kinase [Ancylomarina sp. DW003]MDE5423578.1 histidine kinase [Ancylomarina sp. DW003]
MEHPILSHRYGIYIFLGAWFGFTSLLFVIDWYFQGQIAENAIISSLSISLPLLIIAPSIWYIVKYIDIDKIGLISFLLHHLSAAIISVTIWMSLTHLIHSSFYDDYKSSAHPSILMPNYWLAFMLFALYDYIIMVYYAFIYYRNFKSKIENEADLKGLIREAEINALKSQINPHFLFNSLNSVSSLTLVRPEQSREMLVKLSTFLRYSLDQDLKELNTLENEMKNSRLYLEIEKVRFGDRLLLDFDIDDTICTQKIPNLILQPIYENAIKHGVNESLEPVEIKTKALMKGSNLHLQISNNFDKDAISTKGQGIGLKNIQERLNLIYGSTNLLYITKKETKFIVNLEFPQAI